jgi:hypothetical protein
MPDKIKDAIFDNFGKPIEATDLFAKYKLALLKKAKPSDGSGAIYAAKEAGVEVRQDLKDRSTIETIFLKYYVDGKGWKIFAEEAPCGLAQDMSRTTVKKLLGKPDFSVEKGGIGLMAITNSADKWYDTIGNSIHVEYAEDDNSIRLLSISSKKFEDKFR